MRTHIHEIGENVVDGAHFRQVHQAQSQPETSVTTDGATLRTTSRMRQMTPRGLVDATIDGTAHGLGLWIFRFTGIVETVFLDAATPIDDDAVDVRLSFMVTPPRCSFFAARRRGRADRRRNPSGRARYSHLGAQGLSSGARAVLGRRDHLRLPAMGAAVLFGADVR